MSGKTKIIFVFSRMQPNFMARRDIKLQQIIKNEEFNSNYKKASPLGRFGVMKSAQ